MREIGVTGGDESKVGYYVGIMVSHDTIYMSWSSSTLTTYFDLSAISVLCRRGDDRATLEPAVRPDRAQAGHPFRTFRLVDFDVLFWALEDVLGACVEVSKRNGVDYSPKA